MYERMLNKEIKPTINHLSLYIGSKADLFYMFHSFLSDKYKTRQQIRFPYGDKYGWCVSYYIDKKLICNVFAEKEAFTVMIRLSNQQFEKVYELVHTETKQCINNKYPCGNGGWIHYRVLSNAHLDDIITLTSSKCG